MPKNNRQKASRTHRSSLKKWIIGGVVVCVLGFSNWFVHCPTATREKFGQFQQPLESIGIVTADFTDNLDLTGSDITIPYTNQLTQLSKRSIESALPFGVPTTKNKKLVPNDIKLLKRDGYIAAFSPSLGYPIWSAYAIPTTSCLQYPPARPTKFSQDKEVKNSPIHENYSGSGYDRGHMAPNYVIATRYGKKAQLETFLMTNIAPQKPDLNRGPWRILEKTIADDLSHIGDTIWVITGAVPNATSTKDKLPKTTIRIPVGFYKIIATVHHNKLRVIGVYMPQTIRSTASPRFYFKSIRELEDLSGLNFFPSLSSENQNAIEMREPNRFWPSHALFE